MERNTTNWTNMLSLIINKSTEKLSKCKHIALLVLADMFFYLTSWRMLI